MEGSGPRLYVVSLILPEVGGRDKQRTVQASVPREVKDKEASERLGQSRGMQDRVTGKVRFADSRRQRQIILHSVSALL